MYFSLVFRHFDSFKFKLVFKKLEIRLIKTTERSFFPLLVYFLHFQFVFCFFLFFLRLLSLVIFRNRMRLKIRPARNGDESVAHSNLIFLTDFVFQFLRHRHCFHLYATNLFSLK